MRVGAQTPYLLIDRAKMQQNIEKMAAIAGRNGVALRPHVKTHKIPTIARAQVEAGAAGITVAKVSEAEVMARSEEHTSELQSRQYLVCRLLLEKKKKITTAQVLTRNTAYSCTYHV